MTEQQNRPWYERTFRWGQTNLTEIDPERYDSAWWQAYWQTTRVQGVIVNAGGIVSYYPSRFPLQHRAQFLGDRDLYGEIVEAARKSGLAVIARMDSNRADERFHLEHPDWFTKDADGRPYRAGELYIACVNSPYYDEYLPGVLREIIERTSPDGFADNSWSGLSSDRICYCEHCARRFRSAAGAALPRKHDWDDPVFRQWITWNYARRTEIWDLNNRTTQAAGGADCLWLGMNGGSIEGQARSFRDYKAIAERSRIVMLDHQGRRDPSNFQSNSEAGRLIHGLVGWDKLIPESTALYDYGQPTFRLGSKPEPEARLWALEGFASGIQPWWHHIGSYHEDRRQYRTAEPLFRWHQENEQYLVGRRPIANVGVVWSQPNTDFYGQDETTDRVTLPRRGVVNALLRARIPYLPVHADHIARDADQFDALVLPNIGALSDEQCEAIRRFVADGGGLLATGETSRYDEQGDRRDDFGLADVLGAHATGSHHGSSGSADPSWETWAKHSYLRLPSGAGRHAALQGFEDTDLLGFAGRIEVVLPDSSSEAALTLVPPFPIYPPETSWMRHPQSQVPALLLNDATGGRVAFLPADVDRCFGRDWHPDHAALLANLVRWTVRDRIPLEVEGPGVVDCQLYEQPGRLVLHLVNLTGTGLWNAPLHELTPTGPLRVTVRVPATVTPTRAKFLVSGRMAPVQVSDGELTLELPPVGDHEVVVFEQ